MSAAIATPLLLLTLIMTYSWVTSERARLEAALTVRLEGAVLLVDQYLSGRIAMLQAMATSRAIDAGDFETLDRQAREVIALHGGQIVVRGLDGTNFVNTRLNWDAALPRGRIVEADLEAVKTKSPYVDDLYTTMLDGSPVLRIVVPVLRDDQVAYTMVSDVPPQAVEALLQRAGITAPFFASVTDRKGLVLARAEKSGRYVGKRLPGFERAIGQHGFWSGKNPEGITVEAAFQRSAVSGWLFSIGVDKAALDAKLRMWMWFLGAVSLSLLLLAAFVALTVARNLLRSQRRVAEVVRSLGRGELVEHPETSLVEANKIADALVDASHQIRNHAAVLAAANQTLEERVAERTKEVSAQAELLQATLDNMDQGLFLIAPDGTVPIANRRSLQLLGLPTRLMAAARPAFTDILRYQLQSDEFAKSEESLRIWVESGGMLDEPHEYERERPDGTILEIRTIPLPNGGAVRTYTDVTQPRRREMALQTSQAEYRDLFENAVVGIFRTTRDGMPLRANPALVRLNGYDSEAECLSKSRDLQRDWYVEPGRRAEFITAMDAHGRVTEFESEVYRHCTGERIWVSETAWSVVSPVGETLWYEGTVAEITERKRAEAAIVYTATHDGLTGLPNREFFVQRLGEQFTDEGPAPESLALLYLDLDQFKAVNDTMGHPAGDALLQHVAERLREALGPDDVAARIGGDEFVVIQVGAEQPADAEMLAQHLLDLISRPFMIEGRPITIGLSVGIAIRPEERSDADQLLIDADVALYLAKDAGRQTYRIFEPGMAADKQERRNLELDLRGAIERSELLLHYQPQIAIDSGQVTGFEALVRWAHPVRGLCSPDTFIPLAEEAGLIVEIGDWVLRTACAEAMTWPSDMRVAANVSALQFSSGDLCRSVIQALAISKLPPERLELEITESVLLANDVAVTAILAELRSFGVRIALDDFGTGFSSLGYLRSYRFDKIKIDRSFVRDIADPGTLDIVRAIVSLGRSRSMIITAEGVETAEQLALVSAEGCGEAQGYLIARPMSAESVCPFLLSLRSAVAAA